MSRDGRRRHAALPPRAAAGLGALVLAACAGGRPPALFPEPPPLPAPPAAPAVRETPTPGSLWRGAASRRFLAFENRARGIGDLVTVRIVEQAQAEKEASTELDRTSTFEATLGSDVALQTLVAHPIRSVLRLLGFSRQRHDHDPRTELSIADAETKAKFDGEGKLKREATFETTVACIVTAVTPSGLLRIEGERHLRINRETQVIRISGYVRPEDIRIDNTIPSTLVASADIEYSGVGVASDQQRVPWLFRIFEIVLPF